MQYQQNRQQTDNRFQMDTQRNELVNIGQCLNLAHAEALASGAKGPEFDKIIRERTVQLMKLKAEITRQVMR